MRDNWPSFTESSKSERLEVAVEPLEEIGLEDAALAVEGISGEPDQLRLVKAQLARGLELLAELVEVDEMTERNSRAAIGEGEFGVGFGEMLPDELEHEELVEVGIEQRARDRIEFPVMVVGAASEVDDHSSLL